MKDIIKNILKEQQTYKYDKLLRVILKNNSLKSKAYHDRQLLSLNQIQEKILIIDTHLPNGFKSFKPHSHTDVVDIFLDFEKIQEHYTYIEKVFVTKQTEIFSYGLNFVDTIGILIKYHEIQAGIDYKFHETLKDCHAHVYKFMEDNQGSLLSELLENYSYDDGSFPDWKPDQVEKLYEMMVDRFSDVLGDYSYLKTLKKMIDSSPGIIECVSQLEEEDELGDLCATFADHSMIFDDIDTSARY